MIELEEKKYDSLSFIQRAAVRHVHPASFVMHLLALIWGGYFLWAHHLWPAVLCFGVFAAVGGVIGGFDRAYLLTARSQLNLFQKLVLYHTDIRNVAFHIAAFLLFLYGMWTHQVPALLGTLSLILLGHIFPWVRHKRKEQQHALLIDEDLP